MGKMSEIEYEARSSDDLVARLRKVDPDTPGERTRWYRNPDGHEAADRIERLETALRKINARLNDTDSWLAQSIDAREIADAALEGKE